MKEKCYVCCDLKSFYASVECVERGLDPMTTNLVVADKRRTDKTICLAVSPSLKAYGISGRARLFEVVQKVKEVNARRQRQAPGRRFTGSSWHDPEVRSNPSLALDYIVAPPRMAHYIDWSTKIYSVYLKYVAPEDIFPYSIDEVFMDVTNYLDTYNMTARELTRTIILDILKTTGITAAAGMGTNLYLAKVAMDIGAKHVPADEYGVRIAELDEGSYRRLLWSHRPLTDFWRVGRGYAAKLEAHRLYTMGDIARCSIGKPADYHNEELLYKLFGVNAEILIDHAWGWEPCTIADVKAYKPENKSIVSGQVLQCPYDFDKARLVVREMADALALDLVDKGLVTNQLVLTVGYDRENLDDPRRRQSYHGPVTTDRYGRSIPKHAVGTENFPYTSSGQRPAEGGGGPLRPDRGQEPADPPPEHQRQQAAGRGGGPQGARGGTAGPVHRLRRQRSAGAGGRGRPRPGAEAPGGHAGHQEAVRQERHPQGDEPGGGRHGQGAQPDDRRASGMSGPYDDIINLPHPTSQRHPRMPIRDRAAIFSPFAALSGHGAAIAETARLTERRMELDEDTRAELDRRQAVLLEHMDEQPEVTITWFQPDERKDGGAYLTATGRLKKFRELERLLVLADGTEIPLEDVVALESDIFQELIDDLIYKW